ncbi:VanZ family protein [Planctomycetota bacterium]|nr:VanZ family protein [Planctomycetota bacterium]
MKIEISQDKQLLSERRLNERAQPIWVRRWMLAVACGLLVAYGSLIPFEFEAFKGWFEFICSPSWQQMSWSRSSLGVPAWVSDWAVNVLLYVPLGLLLRLSFNGKWRKRWIALVVPSLLVIGQSYLTECVQSLSHDRVASLNDVIANGLGGILAIIAAIRVNALRIHITFYLYIRSARTKNALTNHLPTLRIHPTYMFGLLIILILVLLAVHVYVSDFSQLALHLSTNNYHINRLPFYEHFVRSYDVAATLLGSSALIYAMVGALIFILIRYKGIDQHARMTLILVTLLACLIEVMLGVTSNMMIDVTEPIVAFGAVATILGLIHYANRSIQVSCRRKQQVPVAFDRRKRAHDY